jgi:multidrug efflux system membrane fusion protein
VTRPAPKWVGRAVAIGAVVAAVVLVVIALVRYDRRPRTQDAYLYADSISVVPEVSGRIVAVRIRENQRVAKGDPMVEIDPTDFELHLEQARAEVQSLRAQIDQTSREVASQSTSAKAAATQIQGAQSQLGLARDNMARLSPLVDKGYTTPQQFEEARSNAVVAQATLTATIQKAQAARQSVGSTESLLARLKGAEASMALAERNLHHTVVPAPFDGYVSGLDLAPGAYATEGHALFTLIKATEWFAVGNFRETELESIKVGDPAIVWLVGSSNQRVSGHVESLGWGVSPENAGAPGLPQVGRTLNWVVIAQRFPIRVRLDSVPEADARLGGTANILVATNAGR